MATHTALVLPDMAGVAIKYCPGHGRYLPVTSFSLDSTRPDGRSRLCRECDAARCRDYYARNREKELAKDREGHPVYYAANAERIAQRRRAVREQAIAIYGGQCVSLQHGHGGRLEFHHPAVDGDQHRRTEHHMTTARRIVAAGKPLADWALVLLCHEHHVDVHHPRRRSLAS